MSTSTIPLIEKYRPDNLNKVVSHSEIINTLKVFVKEKTMPHLLFYGPSGTGKTSTIMACAKELYGDTCGFMVRKLNASDDRGIEVVRETVKNFVKTENFFYKINNEDCDEKIFKLVILDEADAMTEDAQAILRQVIEKYTDNARFCLICNYIGKINPALQSRCTMFRFRPLKKVEMKHRIKKIAKDESINITESGVETILCRANGDMRRALNILQLTSMTGDKINEDAVNKYTCYPQKVVIEEIIKNLFEMSYSDAYHNILELQKEYGISLTDIVTEIHKIVVNHIMYDSDNTYLQDLEDQTIKMILGKLCDIEYHLSTTTTDNIQLGAMIGLFKLGLANIEYVDNYVTM